MAAGPPAGRVRRPTLSFCFTPVYLILILFAAAPAGRAAPPPDFPGHSPRSAARTFLQLISGVESGAWPSVRVASLPVLLLPVAVQDTLEFDQNKVGPIRRRPESAYASDGGRDWAAGAGDWSDDPPRRPTYAAPDSYVVHETNDAHDAHTAQNADDQDEYVSPAAHRPAPRAPLLVPNETSQRLVEKFRAQAPRGAAPPAVLLAGCRSSERVLPPAADDDDDDDDERAEGGAARAPPRGTPPRPRWARPLLLRAVLSVPRAGFSENYTAWWDPNSGDARVHFQEGSTVTFRKFLPNGLLQRVEMHVDRSDGRAVRRCALSTAAAGAADRAAPALPDLQLFSFAGYAADGAERWTHRADAAPGEGGARGEALSALHELLLRRGPGDEARPLRYSVAVNSSVLGACDGYEHVYAARTHSRDPDFYEADLELCDELTQLDAREAAARARLEPLREFTLPRRDARYDAELQRFKEENNRQYVDDVEEAVRKNVLIQSARFVASANRAGATFRLGLNFLADRLDAELRPLQDGARGGVQPARAPQRARRSPGPPRGRVSRCVGAPGLPPAFDWRARGAVTPVRFQGLACASCWAFATVGALEGALARVRGNLTALSEQQLVDCAHEFGARGCNGTWPSRAYDYIQERGLSALEDYTPYKGEVQSCRQQAVPAATRISGHVNVTKFCVPALQEAIYEHGPAVVIVDSSPKSFLLYKKGVLYDDRCSKKSSKHAMVAVGWGTQQGEPYFVLKNSWSAAWGDRGYVRVQARANTCGVLTHPSFPRLERAGDPL